LPPLSEVRDLDAISREVEDRLQEELALDEQAQQGDQTPETNE